MPSLNKMSEDNILYVVRLICLIFLLVVLFYQHDINYKIKEPIVQIIIAFIVLFVFIFIDPLSGFFIACTVFIIYYKFYSKDSQNPKETSNIKKNNNIPYGSYITQDHLDMAQNNTLEEQSSFELSKMQIFNNPIATPTEVIPGYEKPWNSYD